MALPLSTVAEPLRAAYPALPDLGLFHAPTHTLPGLEALQINQYQDCHLLEEFFTIIFLPY